MITEKIDVSRLRTAELRRIHKKYFISTRKGKLKKQLSERVLKMLTNPQIRVPEGTSVRRTTIPPEHYPQSQWRDWEDPLRRVPRERSLRRALLVLAAEEKPRGGDAVHQTSNHGTRHVGDEVVAKPNRRA